MRFTLKIRKLYSNCVWKKKKKKGICSYIILQRSIFLSSILSTLHIHEIYLKYTWAWFINIVITLLTIIYLSKQRRNKEIYM